MKEKNAVSFKAFRTKRQAENWKWMYEVYVHDENGKKHEVGCMEFWYPLEKKHRKILKDVLEI